MTETEDALPDGHYRVPFAPEDAVLDTFFRPDELFFSSQYPWTTPDAWREEAERPGERIFFVKQFEEDMYLSGIREWLKGQPYRPATHLEAIAFALARPDAVLEGTEKHGMQNWLLALGSTVQTHGHPHAAVLMPLGGGISLGVAESRDKSFPFVKEGRYLFIKIQP